MRDMDRAAINRMVVQKLVDPEFRRRLTATAPDGTRPIIVGLRTDMMSEIIVSTVRLGGAANIAVPWLNGILIYTLTAERGHKVSKAGRSGHIGDCSLGVFLERLRCDGNDDQTSVYAFTFDGPEQPNQARAELVAVVG